MNERIWHESHFRDDHGRLLWKETITLSGLHGSPIIKEGITYIVLGAAIADGVEHINVRKATKKEIIDLANHGSSLEAFKRCEHLFKWQWGR